MTELLYLRDCYAKEFDAVVEKSEEGKVILNKTIFYPEGGGQESDIGYIEFGDQRVPVKHVKKKGQDVIHEIEGMIPKGSEVHGIVDWEHRYKEMRMHTSQHLFSGLVLDELGAETAGNQIHPDKSRIDFAINDMTMEQLQPIVERFNQLTEKGNIVRIEFQSREKVFEDIDPRRRRLFERLPDFIKEIRVINIEGLDKAPCGGTHLKDIKEIGKIKILEVIRKGSGRYRVVYELF